MGKLFDEAADQRLYNALDEIRKKLESIQVSGVDWATQGKDELISFIEGQIEQTHNASEKKGWDFRKEKAFDVLVEDEIVRICPISNTYKQYYLELSASLIACMKADRNIYDQVVWDNRVQADSSFYCIVTDKHNEPMGYIALLDTSCDVWELAIAFDKEHRHLGYGRRVIPLFIDEIQRITGRNQYQALVEVDNPACQGLMGKLGAELVGIKNAAFESEEAALAFEETHLDRIDDQIRELAQRINIEPRRLLSHVLDYRLKTNREM